MTLTFNCGTPGGVPQLLYIGRFSFSGRMRQRLVWLYLAMAYQPPEGWVRRAL